MDHRQWNLDDDSIYFKLCNVSVTSAKTWGGEDREKREAIRKAAKASIPRFRPEARWWAFRIYVRKIHDFDVDNIPKLVVDAFCSGQLRLDRSDHTKLGLYEDDTVANVGMVQVAGERVEADESTEIEIFGRRR